MEESNLMVRSEQASIEKHLLNTAT